MNRWFEKHAPNGMGMFMTLICAINVNYWGIFRFQGIFHALLLATWKLFELTNVAHKRAISSIRSFCVFRFFFSLKSITVFSTSSLKRTFIDFVFGFLMENQKSFCCCCCCLSLKPYPTHVRQTRIRTHSWKRPHKNETLLLYLRCNYVCNS